MPMTCTDAAVMPVLPTDASLCKLNSSPKPNIKKMIPISAQRLMFSTSASVGTKSTTGPIKKPAKI